MSINSAGRRFAGAAAIAGLLALPGAALAANADMSYQRAEYRAAGGERNDVVIRRRSSDSIEIKDRGAYIWSGWGWGQNHGCWTANVSDYDGSYPSVCEHPSGITDIYAALSDGADRLRIGSSAPKIVASLGAGDDQADVRDGNGDDGVFCYGGLDWVLLDPGDRDWDCETVPLGGVLASGPVAASTGGGRLDVFARGGDDDLWYHTWNGSGWLGWAPVPGNGRLVGAPAVTSWGAGRLDVFARGTDDALYHTWYDGGWWAGEWERLGGWLASAPAVASWGSGRLDVFVQWGDGTLRQIYYDIRTGWSGWINFGGQLPFAGRPAVASPGNNRVDVFVRGTDKALHQLSYDGGWGSWQNRGGALESAPAATSRAPGALDVIVKGTDNALWQRTYEAGSWSAWRSIGGDVAGLKSDPGLVAWGSGRLDAFVRISDDSIYQLRLP